MELVRKITEKACSGEILDVDALASSVLQDCKQANSKKSYKKNRTGVWFRNAGKYIRTLSVKFSKKNVSRRIREALAKSDKKQIDKLLQSLYDASENEKQRKSVSDFGKYVMGNWNEIINRKVLNIPGSCTEAQGSHVLSERFSRFDGEPFVFDQASGTQMLLHEISTTRNTLWN